MHVPINSKSSLLDYDIIVFDPDITPFHGYYDEHYLGKVSLDDHGSFSLKEHLDHWKKEIFESIKVGKSIFILLNNIQEVYIATGNKRFFDVSSGFEYISERSCDQVDHDDEGLCVAIASGSCPGGLEQSVHCFHTSVAVG